jgi:site-specific recombinase XerD
VLRYWLDVARPQVAADRAEQALFVTAQGRRLTSRTFYGRLVKLRRIIGLNRLRVHDFRHASALHMVRHGADLRYVQEFLGHAGLKATQIYTRLAPDDLKAVHAKAHPRERHKDRS